MVSLVQRAMVGIEYQVEVLDAPARIVLQCELIANEQLPVTTGDPRVAAELDRPLEAVEHLAGGMRAYLMHRTRSSGLRVAATMDHICDGSDGWASRAEASKDSARITIIAELRPGQTLTLVKLSTIQTLETSTPAEG